MDIEPTPMEEKKTHSFTVGAVTYWWNTRAKTDYPQNIYAKMRCPGCGETFAVREKMPTDGYIRSELTVKMRDALRKGVDECRACAASKAQRLNMKPFENFNDPEASI